MRARALTDSFISLISLSISSMKWITKSTNLCLYICSVWKLVMRKLMSYPWGEKPAGRGRRKETKLAPRDTWLSHLLHSHTKLPTATIFSQVIYSSFSQQPTCLGKGHMGEFTFCVSVGPKQLNLVQNCVPGRMSLKVCGINSPVFKISKGNKETTYLISKNPVQ